MFPTVVVAAAFLLGITGALAIFSHFTGMLGPRLSDPRGAPKSAPGSVDDAPDVATEGDQQGKDTEESQDLDYVLLTPDQVDAQCLASGLSKCDCSDVGSPRVERGAAGLCFVSHARALFSCFFFVLFC